MGPMDGRSAWNIRWTISEANFEVLAAPKLRWTHSRENKPVSGKESEKTKEGWGELPTPSCSRWIYYKFGKRESGAPKWNDEKGQLKGGSSENGQDVQPSSGGNSERAPCHQWLHEALACTFYWSTGEIIKCLLNHNFFYCGLIQCGYMSTIWNKINKCKNIEIAFFISKIYLYLYSYLFILMSCLVLHTGVPCR